MVESGELVKQFESLSARRAWIEICCAARLLASGSLSLSARRAWIEIGVDFSYDWLDAVALRKESVDRNIKRTIVEGNPNVALRKESVDRNIWRC